MGLIEGGKEIEQRLQLSFSKYLIRGEWFKPGWGLLEYIKKEAKFPKTLKKKVSYKNKIYYKDVELENVMGLDVIDIHVVIHPLTERQIYMLLFYLQNELKINVDFMGTTLREKLQIIIKNREILQPKIKKEGLIKSVDLTIKKQPDWEY